MVVLRARTTGVAAVWAAGLRARDGARPAVLAAAPGVVEDHAVWLATPDQIAVLDRCEGRDERFRLARLRTGLGRGRRRRHALMGARDTEVRVERPWVYLGHAEIRRPLLVDGAPVRCADVPQEVAMTLVGEPAESDGLDADPVTGAPHPDEWPGALFAYGLLQPGQVSWERVRAHATGPAQPTTVAGGVFDTGHGYPAWLPDAPGVDAGRRRAGARPGRAAARARRVRGPGVRARPGGGGRSDQTVCWAYAWRGDREGLVALPAAGRERPGPPVGARTGTRRREKRAGLAVTRTGTRRQAPAAAGVAAAGSTGMR